MSGFLGTHTCGDPVPDPPPTSVPVEFSVASAADAEDSGVNLPVLLVNGTLTADQTIDVTITGGTADGSDVTNTVTVTIPAGTYDGTTGTAVAIISVLSINADALVEPGETLELELANPSASLAIGDANGDSTTQATHTYTIDNDDFLGGLVFDDLDNDGVFELGDGDAGIEGVLMRLVNETSGAVVDTDTTDASGRYEFDVTLAVGSYKIVEVVDELADLRLLDGIETPGVNGGTVDNSQDSNEITGIDVSGTGTAASAADYLFAEIGGSDIFGRVWRDLNNDGEINFGEVGITGVMLTLSGTDDRGNSVSDTAITGGDGSYALVDRRPGTYMIQETQPAGFDDGQESLGEVTDLGLPTAVADPGFIDGNDKFSGVQLVPKSEGDMYNFGERPQAGDPIGDSVTATIGFWHNKNGQALIESLNGIPTSTQLGDWLAATFPSMYGPGAFYDAARGDDQDMNLTGKTNEEVAQIFKYLHKRNKKTAVAGGPPKVDAQVLALAVYSTSKDLAGGDYAASYGFNTSADGIGYTTFNVLDVLTTQEADDLGLTPVMDTSGNATIIDILLTTNSETADGLLYDANDDDSIDSFEGVLRTLANELYTAINEGSDI